jgi:integrase
MSSRKRGHGSGSVTQLPDGRWQARASYWDNGRLRRKAVYGKRRREAEQRLRELLARLDHGERPLDERTTVAEYLERWLAIHRDRLRPSTARRYEQLVRLQLVPELGRLRVARLVPSDVERAMQRLRERGLSARTIAQCRAVLRRALQDALRDGVIQRNVAALARPPAIAPPQTSTWTADEARAFLAAADQHWLVPLFQLLLATGLRLGEALGLSWEDVDEEGGMLAVRWQLQHTGGQFLRLPPKSKQSRRTLPLPALARAALVRQREQQAAWRQEPGWVGNQWSLVFTTRIGTPLHPRNVHHGFTRLVEQAGLPRIRIHDLRHSCATLLLESGVDLKVVSALLGHSQLSVTADYYAHVRQALAADAIRRLDALLGQG